MFLAYTDRTETPAEPLAGGIAAAWDLAWGTGPLPVPPAPAARPLAGVCADPTAAGGANPPAAPCDRPCPAQGPSRVGTVRPLTPANDAGTDLGSETTA